MQAFLLTAINLMRLARPSCDLQQPEGPALIGIAAGNAGEIVMDGDRLVFYRLAFSRSTQPAPSTQSSPHVLDEDEVEL